MLWLAVERSDAVAVARLFRHSPAELRASKALALDLIRATGNWQLALATSLEVQADRDFVLAVIGITRQCDVALWTCSPFLHERWFVLRGCALDPMLLQWTSARLRDDFDVVHTAVLGWGGALRFASPRLRANSDIALSAVRSCVHSLNHASQALRDDTAFMRSALLQNSAAMAYASTRLRANRDFVRFAVRLDGLALSHASTALWHDEAIVFSAVTNNGSALIVASEALRDKASIVCIAVAGNAMALSAASPRLRDDATVVGMAARANVFALAVASPRLLDDVDFITSLVRENGDALAYAGEAVRASKAVALIAARNARTCFNPSDFKVPSWLSTDDDFLMELAISSFRRGVHVAATALVASYMNRIATSTPSQLDALADRCGTIAANCAGFPLAVSMLEDLDAPNGRLRGHREVCWHNFFS